MNRFGIGLATAWNKSPNFASVGTGYLDRPMELIQPYYSASFEESRAQASQKNPTIPLGYLQNDTSESVAASGYVSSNQKLAVNHPGAQTSPNLASTVLLTPSKPHAIRKPRNRKSPNVMRLGKRSFKRPAPVTDHASENSVSKCSGRVRQF